MLHKRAHGRFSFLKIYQGDTLNVVRLPPRHDATRRYTNPRLLYLTLPSTFGHTFSLQGPLRIKNPLQASVAYGPTR